MTEEQKYLLGCLFAVDMLMRNSHPSCTVQIDGKWETISWSEIREWIEKQFKVEQGE